MTFYAKLIGKHCVNGYFLRHNSLLFKAKSSPTFRNSLIINPIQTHQNKHFFKQVAHRSFSTRNRRGIEIAIVSKKAFLLTIYNFHLPPPSLVRHKYLTNKSISGDLIEKKHLRRIYQKLHKKDAELEESNTKRMQKC